MNICKRFIIGFAFIGWALVPGASAMAGSELQPEPSSGKDGSVERASDSSATSDSSSGQESASQKSRLDVVQPGALLGKESRANSKKKTKKASAPEEKSRVTAEVLNPLGVLKRQVLKSSDVSSEAAAGRPEIGATDMPARPKVQVESAIYQSSSDSTVAASASGMRGVAGLVRGSRVSSTVVSGSRETDRAKTSTGWSGGATTMTPRLPGSGSGTILASTTIASSSSALLSPSGSRQGDSTAAAGGASSSVIRPSVGQEFRQGGVERPKTFDYFKAAGEIGRSIVGVLGGSPGY